MPVEKEGSAVGLAVVKLIVVAVVVVVVVVVVDGVVVAVAVAVEVEETLSNVPVATLRACVERSRLLERCLFKAF